MKEIFYVDTPNHGFLSNKTKQPSKLYKYLVVGDIIQFWTDIKNLYQWGIYIGDGSVSYMACVNENGRLIMVRSRVTIEQMADGYYFRINNLADLKWKPKEVEAEYFDAIQEISPSRCGLFYGNTDHYVNYIRYGKIEAFDVSRQLKHFIIKSFKKMTSNIKEGLEKFGEGASITPLFKAIKREFDQEIALVSEQIDSYCSNTNSGIARDSQGVNDLCGTFILISALIGVTQGYGETELSSTTTN
uniref:LRAT domain-containing protein n=1 Tax=Rhabditophanes sp. KR3021 TaxID=114890 RepID=A0AC35UFF3_9BILA